MKRKRVKILSPIKLIVLQFKFWLKPDYDLYCENGLKPVSIDIKVGLRIGRPHLKRPRKLKRKENEICER